MDLRRPQTPILQLLALVIAALAGFFAWQALAKSQTEPEAILDALQQTTPAFRDVEKLELDWVQSEFSEEQVLAPLAPLPCPGGISSKQASSTSINAAKKALRLAESGQDGQALGELAGLTRSGDAWLATLVAGQMLVAEGKRENAIEVLDKALANNSARDAFRRLRREIQSGKTQGADRLRGYLSLYYASGQARLREGIHNEELWYALRHAIGACTALTKGFDRSFMDDEPCRIEQVLAAPGCSNREISSYDLYNNLLVGYLQVTNYHASKDGRRREFGRSLEPSAQANPLAAVLRQAWENWTEDDWNRREHWLWAISNAESLMRANGQQPPKHAHLSFHLAQLMESALNDAPNAAKGPLRAKRDALILTSHELLPSVRPSDGRAQLANGLARLEALARLRDGSDIGPGAYSEFLDGDQRQVSLRLMASLEQRQATPQLARNVLGDGSALEEIFGDETGPWTRAVRRDLASALADIDKELAFGVLQVGDGVPNALAGLGGLRALLHKLRGSPLGWIGVLAIACFVFLIVLVLGLWIALQMRRRKELFTSFYRREAIARMEGS